MEGNDSESSSTESTKISVSSLPWREEEEDAAEGAVFVALPEKYEDGKSVLKWALNHFSKDEVGIIVGHVHKPSEMIPLLGTEVYEGYLEEEMLNAYRQLEREKIDSLLNKYLVKCQKKEFKAFKMLLKFDDVAKVLVDLIRVFKITKFVMGAAADSGTKVSEKANKIMQEADPRCKIWFIYRGKLIYTRNSSSGENEEVQRNTGSLSLPMENDQSLNSSLIPLEEGEMAMSADILRKSSIEADNFRKRADEESGRREKNEKEMFWACQKVMLSMTKMTNESRFKEVQWKNETKEFLEREKENRDLLKQEFEQLKEKIQLLESQRDENINKLRDANEQKLTLEERISDYEHVVNELEDNLELVRSRLDSLQMENNILNERISESHVAFNTKFSLTELLQATENFSESKKIGEGGFGCVYKANLHNTTVAIKKLNPHSLQDRSQFEQEVAILSCVRHPNIVTFMGACSEASALVYEYLPNGSLEDRINCLNNTPPLTWQVRTRIIGEICSALIFLHSSRPHPVVHGDLKPDNILLDANLVSKTSDFGISRLLMESSISSPLHRTMNPKGTIAYMDPELLSTGELTPKSDVYSLGVIILRLLTGKPPLNIANEVELGADEDVQHLIDESAREWPFVQARKLAYIGLRCADVRRRSRPDLVSEVWPVVEPLMKAASLLPSPCYQSLHDDKRTPSYFICPILQDVMSDPHMAADGYTYEAEAIKGWLDSGRNTSPMTNLRLPNLELIPNHALRSAIQEWHEQHPQS